MVPENYIRLLRNQTILSVAIDLKLSDFATEQMNIHFLRLKKIRRYSFGSYFLDQKELDNIT